VTSGFAPGEVSAIGCWAMVEQPIRKKTIIGNNFLILNGFNFVVLLIS
jgi:hypothetical protein